MNADRYVITTESLIVTDECTYVSLSVSIFARIIASLDISQLAVWSVSLFGFCFFLFICSFFCLFTQRMVLFSTRIMVLDQFFNFSGVLEEINWRPVYQITQ